MRSNCSTSPRILAYALAFVAVMLVIETFLVQPLERHVSRWRPRDGLRSASARRSASAAGGTHAGARRARVRARHGEVGALVGPSGCGKTTLLRIIAGLDRDFEGTCRAARHGRLGMVFQEPRLLPWRTVEQNVRLAAPEGDRCHARRRCSGSLGLTAHRSHFPGELSLGLARRVALARAFAVEPDLLLLDEPFVSLDDALPAACATSSPTLVRAARSRRCWSRTTSTRRSGLPTGCSCCRRAGAHRRRGADRHPARGAQRGRTRQDQGRARGVQLESK